MLDTKSDSFPCDLVITYWEERPNGQIGGHRHVGIKKNEMDHLSKAFVREVYLGKKPKTKQKEFNHGSPQMSIFSRVQSFIALHPSSRCSSPLSTSLSVEIRQTSHSVAFLRKDNSLLPPVFSQRADISVHQPPPSDPSLRNLQSSQINRDSAGHSWSLPQTSGPHWAQTHSSPPPSPPGWWCRQTEPGQRCLWSARWRRVPHWWRHEPTSQRSASRMPLPASQLLGGSPTRSNELRWSHVGSGLSRLSGWNTYTELSARTEKTLKITVSFELDLKCKLYMDHLFLSKGQKERVTVSCFYSYCAEIGLIPHP